MKLEQMTDASEVLGCGVFCLVAQGKVVFVGRSTRTMLGKIANYRSKDMPRMFQRIVFDKIYVKFVHPDQLNEVYFDLIATYQPRYNATTLASATSIEPRINSCE